MKTKFFIVLTIISMFFMLGGCDSADYDKALSMYREGDYEQAIQAFEKLGGYKDSADKALESKYKYAESLYETGSYTEAIVVYEELDDFKDSSEKVTEIKYIQAEELYAAASYEEAIDIYEEIVEYNDSASKIVAAEKEIKYITYADAYAALTQGTWFYEASSINAVNVITFTKEAAAIKEIYYDGNGQHVTSPNECEYSLTDKEIKIVLSDGSEMNITYVVNGSEITLGNGEYFTPAQIDSGLQGYWRNVSYTFSIITTKSEDIFFFDNGTVMYESACPAYGYNDGSYYYYGPYEGTYTIDDEGIHSEIRNSWNLGFVIKDGAVVMNNCGDNCSPCDGFKGEDGYSF